MSEWSKITHALCKSIITCDGIPFFKIIWICEINYERDRHGSDQHWFHLILSALINYFKLHYRLMLYASPRDTFTFFSTRTSGKYTNDGHIQLHFYFFIFFFFHFC